MQEKNIGHIVLIIGPVLDIRFQNGKLPNLLNAIEIEKEGKDIMIGFNPKFLIDALRVIEDEQVDLYFMNAKAPCFIRNENKDYIYVVLPVNF